MKKIKTVILILCSVLLLAGCGIIEVTDENKCTATIDPHNLSNDELFKDWSPLNFVSGQTFDYNFDIFTGTYSVNGNFVLTVKGKAPDALRFYWRFIIGNETKTGSFLGSSKDFLENLKEFCFKESVFAMVYQALFASYEDADLYNRFIAQSNEIKVGYEWETSYKGQTYIHSIEAIESYGSIDGYSVLTSINDIPTQLLCISPFIQLPAMSMYFLDTSSGNDSYIICELTGAILPQK